MSLFSRRESSPIPSTNFSVVDSHCTVSGDMETDGALRIDGRVEGSINRADLVVVGEGAAVVGDITAREVIVGGAVTGNIFAAQRTELQSNGIVAGDIRSAAILVQEGGVVQGRLYIHPISGPTDSTDMRTALSNGSRTSGETEAPNLSPALFGK
jgi:cytoskeletal protein CcmA (bactofilin family)